MIPTTSLVVPLAFPLRIADEALVTVTVEHFAKFSNGVEHTAPTWTRDEVAKVNAVSCFTMMHAAHVRARACIVMRPGAHMPTAPRGVVAVGALPPYDPVEGLLVFGPCR